MNDSKILYVITGFMRTGTSMMMKALEDGGLETKYRQSREKMKERFADKHYDPNIGGLYELENEDYMKIDFPVGYEGKLIKALNQGPLSMQPMPDGIRMVFMRRDVEEIRQSYIAFFSNNISIDKLNERTEMYIKRINNRKDVLSLDILWYRDVISNPKKYFQQLQNNGWPINIEKAVKVVDSKLCRYKKEELTPDII